MKNYHFFTVFKAARAFFDSHKKVYFLTFLTYFILVFLFYKQAFVNIREFTTYIQATEPNYKDAFTQLLSRHILFFGILLVVGTWFVYLVLTFTIQKEVMNADENFLPQIKKASGAYLLGILILYGCILLLGIGLGLLLFLFGKHLIIMVLVLLFYSIGYLYFLLRYRYIPYTAFLNENTKNIFKKTKIYMKGHLGGSFTVIIIMPLFSSLFIGITRMIFLNNTSGDIVTFAGLLLGGLFLLIGTWINYFIELMKIYYVTFGYAHHDKMSNE